MRLWSVAPHYLDAKGLVALWREALLAQAVLHGKTKGYKNHPQLNRFRERKDLLRRYLVLVCDEADKRGYKFDRAKILPERRKEPDVIPVSKGQALYEFAHLLNKLKTRDPARYESLKNAKGSPKLFEIFKMTPGENTEPWEIV